MLQCLSLPSSHVCTHRELCCPISMCRKYQVVAQIKMVSGMVRPLLLTSNCSSGGDPGEQARQLFPPWMLRMTGKFSWPKARLWTQKIFSGREKKAGKIVNSLKKIQLCVFSSSTEHFILWIDLLKCFIPPDRNFLPSSVYFWNNLAR